MIDELKLFLAALRTSEGALFAILITMTIAHICIPSDEIISGSMKAAFGALLFALRATPTAKP